MIDSYCDPRIIAICITMVIYQKYCYFVCLRWSVPLCDGIGALFILYVSDKLYVTLEFIEIVRNT